MPGSVVAIILGVLLLGIVIRVLAGSADRRRIEDDIKGQRGRIVSINWAPFGKGWFGEKNDRIYEVVYYDTSGQQHLATCKTSVFGSVFWSQDRVAHSKPRWFDRLPPKNEPGHPPLSVIDGADSEGTVEADRLREENARLRAELARLKEQ